ncbi:MAG TPA: class I SAM-dependent methyltransferase [Ktedonobacteraceae bacterium]|nr:class I SAM-dependent methyltransferase [Ktedonobacteraceae bacterium]
MQQISNDYWLDSEELDKIKRIMDQASFVTHGMGELLSEEPSNVCNVLELGCGPGEWALSLAQRYPHLHVTGIDIEEKLIAYAKMQAEAAELSNVTFQRLSAFNLPKRNDLPTLDTFPDASFDLINGRFFGTLVSRELWYEVLQQCYRLLCPGGILQFTDHAPITTNSPAVDEWLELVFLAQLKRGQKRCKSESAIIVQSTLLEEKGFHIVGKKPYAIDFSFGQAAHNSMSTILLREVEEHQTFLSKTMNLITMENYEALKERMLAEFQAPEFKGIWFLCTVKGKRP